MSGGFWLILSAAILLLCYVVRLLILAARLEKKRPEASDGLHPDPQLSEQAAQSLSDLIPFQTVSREGLTQFSSWTRLRDQLRLRYPRVHAVFEREVIGSYSLLFRWPALEPTEEPILFCAHLDVVPADGAWTHPPFGGEIHDGEVWGRGALDCKGTLVSLLEAAESLLEKGFRPTRDIFFAFGHDEEIGGADGAGAMADWMARHGLHFAMVLDEGTFVRPDYLDSVRPVAQVAVTEKGFVNLRMRATAPAGHASLPPKITANSVLSEAICRIQMTPRRAHFTDLSWETLSRLAPCLSFGTRVFLQCPFLFRRLLARRMLRAPDTAALMRSTVATTVIRAGQAANVLPATADAVLNVRLLHGDTIEDVLRHLGELTRDLPISFEAGPVGEPSQISDYKGEVFETLTQSIQAVFGGVCVVPALMPGGADARRYEPLSPCVFRFSPFVLTKDEQMRIHGRDERISVEALGRAVLFYEDLFSRLAGTPGLMLSVDQLDFETILSLRPEEDETEAPGD